MKRRWMIRVAVFLLMTVSAVWAFDYWVGIPRLIPTAPWTGRIRVLTFNVQADRTPNADTVRVIRDADADVVCVQEAGEAWHRFLRHQLRDRYLASMFRDSYGGFGGLAYYSKYSLTDIRYQPAPAVGRFPSWVVEAETSAGPVQIANVHLRPLVSGIGGKVVGYFSIPRTHKPEIETVIAVMNRDRPAMVVGDFNGEADDPGVKRLVELGFLDALPHFGDRSKTWRGRVLKVPIKAQPDHLLVSPHFSCLSARVLDSGGSDHCAVLGEFVLKTGPTAASCPAN